MFGLMETMKVGQIWSNPYTVGRLLISGLQICSVLLSYIGILFQLRDRRVRCALNGANWPATTQDMQIFIHCCPIAVLRPSLYGLLFASSRRT